LCLATLGGVREAQQPSASGMGWSPRLQHPGPAIRKHFGHAGSRLFLHSLQVSSVLYDCINVCYTWQGCTRSTAALLLIDVDVDVIASTPETATSYCHAVTLMGREDSRNPCPCTLHNAIHTGYRIFNKATTAGCTRPRQGQKPIGPTCYALHSVVGCWRSGRFALAGPL